MSDINWQDGAIGNAYGCQFFICDGLAYDENNRLFGDGWESGLIEVIDFQLNEIRTGDFIPASELDTEQKYNDVVEVFGLFCFPRYEDCTFEENESAILVADEYGDFTGQGFEDKHCKRQLTYPQIMAIGKLKRMMLERAVPAVEFGVVEDELIDHQTLGNKASSNKYEREITDRQGNSATVDVYDVLKAFNVTCPATQHAVKKLLCSGLRGHKDLQTDLIEARESIVRAIELN